MRSLAVLTLALAFATALSACQTEAKARRDRPATAAGTEAGPEGAGPGSARPGDPQPAAATPRRVLDIDEDTAEDTDESAFRWHVLVPGPESIRLKTSRPDRAVLQGLPSAPGQYNFNRRQIFTRADAARSRDQQVCATWTRATSDSVQQGLAVRVRTGPGRRQRAVTVTKNVWVQFFWVFNLHTWDTRRRGDPMRQFGQFDMHDVVMPHGELLPFPWRVCLRVRGRAVAFKVWLPRSQPEPSWSDPVHVREATVPKGFSAPGRPGWYIGHLPPTGSTRYTALAVVPSGCDVAGRIDQGVC